jgi:peptidoglycan/LPS O-acetylase OafA/YrhL
VGVALLCLALRIVTCGSNEFTYLTHLRPTHLRIDSLFFGVCIAYFSNFHPAMFKRIAERFSVGFLFLGGILLLPAFIYDLETTWMIPIFGFSIFYVGWGMVLVGMLGLVGDSRSRVVSGSRLVRLLALIGVQSYSIYLWHYMYRYLLILHICPFFGLSQYENWFIYAVLYLAGSVLLGIGMGKVVEAPALRIRDRYFPSRRSA